ncbi:MAG: hypothetical protein MJ068_01050 [Clostridia bacterium]|nr:hypothetical protein [Clostridia bacterium]
MEYTGEGINALVCAMDDLENASLIFVDQRLRTVLRCIAYYPEFRDVLAYCNQNFDYENEKRKALGKIGETYVLRLPKSPKNMVAFVSQLLVEFDAGLIDIVTFAGKYYPQENKQDSYKELYFKVLEPFKFAIVKFVTDGINDAGPVIEKKVDFAPEGLHQQTEYLLVNMVKAVQEAEIETKDREEFSVMLEGFASALDSRDSLLIKAVWLGLSRALESKHLCSTEIDKVNEVFKLFLIVK